MALGHAFGIIDVGRHEQVRLSKKNRSVQIMALVLVGAILLPAILAGFLMGWIWLLLLMALIFVPVLFLEPRMDRS